MKKEFLLKLGVLVSYIIMVSINALANILPINNLTTGEISDLYPNLFTPVGITFSIWGVIYILLLGFVVVQFGFKQKSMMKHEGVFVSKEDSNRLLNHLRIVFIISSLLNALWIICWHYLMIGSSLIVMLLLLICLIIAYRIQKNSHMTFFLKAPFSVYLGWISVATIANVTVWLTAINWSGFGISDLVWTFVVILAAIGLGIIYRRDIFYNLVISWALFGIVLRHMASDYHVIAWLCIVGIITCLMVSGTTILKAKKERG